MPRKYQHVQQQLGKITKMLESGKTQAEVAEALGLSGKEVIHNLLARERKKSIQGIPKQRGRKPKPAETLEEYKKENERLKMENELLRDFLSLTERK